MEDSPPLQYECDPGHIGIAKALPRRGGDLNDTGLDPRALAALMYALIACALLQYSVASLPLSLFSMGQLWVLGLLRSQQNDDYSLHNLCFVASTMFFCSIVNPSAPVLFSMDGAERCPVIVFQVRALVRKVWGGSVFCCAA